MNMQTTKLEVQKAHTNEKIKKQFISIFLIVVTLLWLVPILAALITSVRTMDDISQHGLGVSIRASPQQFPTAWRNANARIS